MVKRRGRHLSWHPPLLTTTPHQREDVSALDRFNVHRCPTRRVFSGTGLEPVTKQAAVRYLYHSATAATNHPSNIIERERYGGHGVLVWEGIMLGSRTDLHIFDAGSVNGTRYCNGILLPYVRLFRGAMGLQFLFMDDNAPCHRTVAAEQLLESEDIKRMDWPARSPDLNPIEHVWDFLGRRLAARTLPPVTIRELLLALQDEGAAMPQQLIDTLILSMGRRCETCLAVRGDHIPY
ncbi:transposable element Tcb2 transposase [Trichonephila clavipes]|uniref:Transposable element Tcb2 transposase n=1 Tax=Trichonephila clavipes TaxID=2585209 RepID=A0A8X6W449_TRICX|nr:transposable element Tcb2 transposase [Trichonephila clavipes]